MDRGPGGCLGQVRRRTSARLSLSGPRRPRRRLPLSLSSLTWRVRPTPALAVAVCAGRPWGGPRVLGVPEALARRGRFHAGVLPLGGFALDPRLNRLRVRVAARVVHAVALVVVVVSVRRVARCGGHRLLEVWRCGAGSGEDLAADQDRGHQGRDDGAREACSTFRHQPIMTLHGGWSSPGDGLSSPTCPRNFETHPPAAMSVLSA